MRRIQIVVSEEHIGTVTRMLEEEDVDYLRQRVWRDGEQKWVLECPVPTDSVGYLLEELEAAGASPAEYTTITSLETAMTPQSDRLQERFADDFDPLTRPELRSKARDMSRDTRSFLVMTVLSSVIAVGGLLVGSPAVVVGSMVIAPLVGPVLTAAVGAVTEDRAMLWDSIRLQLGGIAATIAGALVVSAGLKFAGIYPPALDVASVDLIALRLAPSIVTVLVGVAAGAAVVFGLTTKGPTSLIGVMIAAALVPAAATTGIAAAWGRYRVAVGSLVLVLVTVALINVSAVTVLWQFEYRSERTAWLSAMRPTRRSTVVLTGAVLVLTATVGVATADQLSFERTVSREVGATFEESDYDHLSLESVRVQYSRFPGDPPEVTVVANRPARGEDTPALADEIDGRVTAATGRDVLVRVRYRAYQYSTGASLSLDATSGTGPVPARRAPGGWHWPSRATT